MNFKKIFMRTAPAIVCVGILLGLQASCGAVDRQYKRRHQKVISKIVDGKIKQALADLENLRQAAPDDPETHFCYAVAYASDKRIDKAMAHVKKALDAGLPFGRFQAGPRELLDPLAESEEFAELAAGHSPLIHGPMVGDITDSGAKFWIRTAGPAEFRVELMEIVYGGEPKKIKSPTVQTTAESDFTAVAEVKGLSPNSIYACDVVGNLTGAKKRAFSKSLRGFRTFPPAGKGGRFSVVFGGGAGYTPKYERMWNTIGSHDPIAMLLLGDNVYIDAPKDPARQRYCYYRRQSRPEWRKLVAATGVYAIWDDHDFGTNDCSGGPKIDSPPWKRKVWNVFRHNWVNPSYGGGRERPGCWFSFNIGDVEFFMLDCRYYRDDKANPPDMLGDVQEAWLKKQLNASRATFKVIASSVPMAEGTKPGWGGRDTWDGFVKQRERIFSFIEENAISGVFIISADRHRSDAWRIERPGYDLYEFESSKLTNIHTHPVMGGALFGYNKKCSFGLLKFDTMADDPNVTYSIINIDNEKIHEMKLKLSQLKAR